MKRIDTKYGRVRICSDHITIKANVEAVNEYICDHDDGYDYILDSVTTIKQDEDGFWCVYEDYTFWSEQDECWVRNLFKDGTVPCNYCTQTLLEAVYLAWCSLLDK